jgi:hypothetical protein
MDVLLPINASNATKNIMAGISPLCGWTKRRLITIRPDIIWKENMPLFAAGSAMRRIGSLHPMCGRMSFSPTGTHISDFRASALHATRMSTVHSSETSAGNATALPPGGLRPASFTIGRGSG